MLTIKVLNILHKLLSHSCVFVSNTIPLFDELCRRVMNFIYICLHCDSNFVRSIVSHGQGRQSVRNLGGPGFPICDRGAGGALRPCARGRVGGIREGAPKPPPAIESQML